uniref:Uncharacterized protein n=1 Tax=Branchiostoma floridae TaxID=7739 RepID=C3ZT21_BRAFL|eukprot:XP_002588355.1 hypothetical protein BRAFLDRAFT_81494 [Branchiostoma floridae]
MGLAMATHQIFVATLLVLLLWKDDRVGTEAREVTMHGRQEEDRCVCTFVSPYLPADYSQSPSQQSRRPDCTDSILDSEFIKQELHFMRRHQIANRKQTLRQGDQLHNLTSRIYQFKDALTANDRVQRSWDMRLLSATSDTRELQRVLTRQRDTIGEVIKVMSHLKENPSFGEMDVQLQADTSVVTEGDTNKPILEHKPGHFHLPLTILRPSSDKRDIQLKKERLSDQLKNPDEVEFTKFALLNFISAFEYALQHTEEARETAKQV